MHQFGAIYLGKNAFLCGIKMPLFRPMSLLHVFNAGHDEALVPAAHVCQPSRAARLMERDLSALPALWASADDVVLLPPDAPTPPEALRRLTPGVRFVTAPADGRPLPATLWEGIGGIAPWGYDLRLRHVLAGLGAPARLLPDAAWIGDVVRPLSSRQTAVGLLPAIVGTLRHALPTLPVVGRSAWCTSASEARAALAANGRSMCKTPWSCSGRGVFVAPWPAEETVWRRIERAIAAQGGVAIEPLYDVAADLAMEFVADHTGVHYAGLSVFETCGGRYGGNVVDSDDALAQRLPETLRPALPTVGVVVAETLHTLLCGRYHGAMGVDMMVVRQTDRTWALHPCVELNLRRTMGMVALTLRPMLPPGTHFRIVPTRTWQTDEQVLAGGEAMTAIVSGG